MACNPRNNVPARARGFRAEALLHMAPPIRNCSTARFTLSAAAARCCIRAGRRQPRPADSAGPPGACHRSARSRYRDDSGHRRHAAQVQIDAFSWLYGNLMLACVQEASASASHRTISTSGRWGPRASWERRTERTYRDRAGWAVSTFASSTNGAFSECVIKHACFARARSSRAWSSSVP